MEDLALCRLNSVAIGILTELSVTSVQIDLPLYFNNKSLFF